MRVKFVCVFTPWFVTCCSPIPLKTKVSLPKNLPLKSFHFKKLFCLFFRFIVGAAYFANTRREFMVPRHTFAILLFSMSKVCWRKLGGRSPEWGSEATKINVWPSLDFIFSMVLKTVHLLLYLFHFGDEPFRLLGGVQQLK